jgi:hypothetical protein
VPAAALKNVKKNAEAAHSVKLKDEQAAKTKKGKGKGASLKYTTEKVRKNSYIRGLNVFIDASFTGPLFWRDRSRWLQRHGRLYVIGRQQE